MKTYAKNKKRSSSVKKPVRAGNVLQSVPNSLRLSLSGQEKNDPGEDLSEALKAMFGNHRLPSELQQRREEPEAVGENTAVSPLQEAPENEVPDALNEGVIMEAPPMLEDPQAQRPVQAVQKRNALFRFGAWLMDKTVGKLDRAHVRAYEDIMEHKADGSYYEIGKWNRFKNFIKNPLSVMHSWGSNKQKWNEKHQQEQQAALDEINAFRAQKQIHALDHDNYKWGQSSERNFPGLQQAVPGQGGGEAKEGKKYSAAQGVASGLGAAKIVAGNAKPIAKNTGKIFRKIKNKVGGWFSKLLGKSNENAEIVEGDLSDSGAADLDKKITTPLVEGLGLAQSIAGLTANSMKAHEARKTGLAGKKFTTGADVARSVLGTLRSGAGAISNITKVYGQGLDDTAKGILTSPSMDIGGGITPLGIIGALSGAVRTAKGVGEIAGGSRTKSRLRDVDEDLGTNDDINDEEKNYLSLLSQQARRGASHRQLKGSLDVVGGAIETGASLSAGIPIAKLAMMGAKTVYSEGAGIAVKQHQKSMDSKVLDEDLPGLDQAIEQYAYDLAVKKGKDPEKVSAAERRVLKRHAKHIVLQAYGFKTGKRSEAVAFFNTARAKYLTNRANTDNGSEGDRVAEDIVKAMGVDKRKSEGAYHEDDVAERLGRGKTQQSVLRSRQSAIGKMYRGRKKK